MEDRTLTKLALITERARQEPQLQFTSLAHLLDVDFLRGCYFELGRDRASGIDGVSWKEYGGTDYTCQDCMGIFAIIIGSSVSYLLAGKFSYSVNFIFMVPVVVFCVYASIKLYSSITNEGIL